MSLRDRDVESLARDGARWRAVLIAVAVGMAYYLGARIGFAFQSPSSPQSVLWLPNSILLAALLVVRPRDWWICLAASFPAQLVSGWQTGTALVPIALLFITNCTDALLGAVLLRHADWRPWRFDGLTSMLRFLALAAVLAPIVVSFADAAITVLTGWGTDFESALITRIRANVLTNVILVPVIVTAIGVDWGRLRSISTSRIVEAAAVVGGVLLTALFAFSAPTPVPGFFGVLVLPLPFLFWAAVRFGPGLTGASLLAVAFVSSWAATHGSGPFRGSSPSGAIDAVQFFLLATSVPLLCLAAVVQDLRRTAAALHTREQDAQRQLAQTSVIYRTAPVGLGFVDRDLRYVSVNDRLAQLHGVPTAAHIGKRVRDVLPAVADSIEPVLEEVIASGKPVVDRELSSPAIPWPHPGEHWLVSYHPVTDAHSAVFGVSIVVRDISQRKRGEAALREAQNALHLSYERIRDLAGRLITTQEAERKRIARDLHDDVNQRLAAVSISLSGLRRTVGDAWPDVRDGLARVQQLTISVAGDIRELSHELHSSVLQHAGLVAALRSACQDVARLHRLDVTFSGAEVGTVPDDVSLCLYRVGQEALRNVVQHAGAARAVIDLGRTPDGIELTIADDGRGFDVTEARTRGGLGLISIEERVRMARGTVELETAPARGTRLRVSVPLEPTNGASARTAGG